MKYNNYNDSELNLLLYEPWEISDRPYMLHASYALSCLYETVVPIDYDDDETFSKDDMWGRTIPKGVLTRLISNIAEDFNDAAENGKRVDIFGKAYSVRKRNAYDPKRLGMIFNFPLENDEYIITKDGVNNLSGPVPDVLMKYETTLEEARANKLYLRQVIMLAEDDDHNGWNKLTDMEIIMYCWALYYNKHQSENLIEFKRFYGEHMYVSMDEIKSCFTEKALLRERPVGMYTFSEWKVNRWNHNNKQKSYAKEISKEDADNYWYDVALKSTFKIED